MQYYVTDAATLAATGISQFQSIYSLLGGDIVSLEGELFEVTLVAELPDGADVVSLEAWSPYETSAVVRTS